MELPRPSVSPASGGDVRPLTGCEDHGIEVDVVEAPLLLLDDGAAVFVKVEPFDIMFFLGAL